jgi:hypothetical protein
MAEGMDDPLREACESVRDAETWIRPQMEALLERTAPGLSIGSLDRLVL